MITLVVAGVIAAWAVPSFMSMIENQRIKTETLELVSALQVARSEAVKLKRPVTVCASNTGTSCTGGLTDWHVGWVIWADRNDSGDLDDVDFEVLRAGGQAKGTVEINLRLSTEAAETASQDVFQFRPDGTTNSANTLVFDVCDEHQNNLGRTITMGATGRPDVAHNTDCTAL